MNLIILSCCLTRGKKMLFSDKVVLKICNCQVAVNSLFIECFCVFFSRCSFDLLFPPVYEVCIQSSAKELAPLWLPSNQWDRPAHSRITTYQIQVSSQFTVLICLFQCKTFFGLYPHSTLVTKQQQPPNICDLFTAQVVSPVSNKLFGVLS